MKVSVKDITRAVEILEKGGVVILPTDTLYGLCCSPFIESSLERIEKIKFRKEENKKPFPLVAGSMNVVEKYFEISPPGYLLAQFFWPGPLSLLLRSRFSHPLLTQNGKSAVRIPDNKILLLILKTLKIPLIATSANVSGHTPPSRVEEIEKEIIERVDMIIDGGELSADRLPSTIYDPDERTVIREGAVPVERIRDVLKR
jgi:L-threonylcarbamoyladenylate synthase